MQEEEKHNRSSPRLKATSSSNKKWRRAHDLKRLRGHGHGQKHHLRHQEEGGANQKKRPLSTRSRGSSRASKRSGLASSASSRLSKQSKQSKRSKNPKRSPSARRGKKDNKEKVTVIETESSTESLALGESPLKRPMWNLDSRAKDQ